MQKLVLFDIDETMVRSDGAGRRAIMRALSCVFRLGDCTTAVLMSGKTDPQIIHEVLAERGFSPAEVEERLEETLAVYPAFLREEIAAAREYRLLDGVRALVEELHSAREDTSLGLLTGNIEAGARLKLEPFALNDFFPVGAYGSDARSRLDLPAIAHRRANEHFRHNFMPEDIVIIGDSVNDIACARHYGAKCLAVNTGRTTRDELMAAGPHFLFSTLADTANLIEAIMSS